MKITTNTPDHCKHLKTKWCSKCLSRIFNLRLQSKILASTRLGSHCGPLIYIASPYKFNPRIPFLARIPLLARLVQWLRFRAVCSWTAALIKERPGAVFFSPIAHSHSIAKFGLPTEWAFWKQQDETYLAACDRLLVLRLPRWEKSEGVQAEIKIAERLGTPIEYLTPKNGNANG